jgi:hypothetical protein
MFQSVVIKQQHSYTAKKIKYNYVKKKEYLHVKFLMDCRVCVRHTQQPK